MPHQVRCFRFAPTLLTAGVLLLATGCSGREAQAGESHSEGGFSTEHALSALEDLDTSTAAGRKAAYDRLRAEYDSLRAQVEQQTVELRGQALAKRDEALKQLIEHCDGLERRLDQLESSGGEAWARLRGEALSEAERLKRECERILNEQP